MKIVLTYTFNETEYDYEALIGWDVLCDYFEEWGGMLPEELIHLIDYDELETDENFLEWLKDYFKETAKEAFDDEYDECLGECVEEALYELEDNPPTTTEELMQYCTEATARTLVSASDLFERLAFHYNLD